jgi:hypothetical protein
VVGVIFRVSSDERVPDSPAAGEDDPVVPPEPARTPRGLLRQWFGFDTPPFVTGRIRRDDESLDAAVVRPLGLVAPARLDLDVSCYVSPSVHDEPAPTLRDRNGVEAAFARLDAWVLRTVPVRYGITTPAQVVSESIDGTSHRVNRRPRPSDEAPRETEQLPPADLAGGVREG